MGRQKDCCNNHVSDDSSLGTNNAKKVLDSGGMLKLDRIC